MTKEKNSLLICCPARTQMSTFEIPNTGTKISDYSISNCFSLETVKIGYYVETIGAFAFTECTNLKTAIIGESVSPINSNTFRNCYNLTYIYYYGEKLQTIGDNAFYKVPSVMALGSF